VDIARPDLLEKKKKRRLAWAAAAVGAVILATLGVSRLKPAAPSVERATLVIDTVRRGEMVREVRGLGTLVPEEIRWIPAVTDARVERLVLLPGTKVEPESVVLELSNPELEMQALEAESQLRAAEAGYTEVKVRLESTRLDQQANAARIQAEYHQAKLRADTDAELAAQPELVRTMSVKPPMGTGKVRLLEIDGVDLQPCGGTHVARTGEIGAIEVTKIENKGKMNRRVNLAFVGVAP